MKKALLLTLAALMFTSSLALAEQQQQKLNFSTNQWYKNGSFDYYLHYKNSSQLMSKVSGPQNQNMTVFILHYKPTETQFIRFQYGLTGTSNNGRGNDSDWTIEGSPNDITWYGTVDFYGKEKMHSLDLGAEVWKDKKQTTNFFVGWGDSKTYNELRNVIYHRINGIDVGNVSQPDNGSTLDGHFYGLRYGIENQYRLDKKLSIDSSIVLKQLTTKAYGHWANHTPAWNWVNKGKTWGYDATVRLIYDCNKDTSTNFGYYYSYAKAKGIDERLTDGISTVDLPGQIDLRYVLHGYYFGLNHKF